MNTFPENGSFVYLSIMNNTIPYSELQLYFNNSGFVLKTQHQLIKDFGAYRLFFDDHFGLEPLTKEEILSAIGEKLSEIMKEGETRLMQLMYTIDIPEQEFLAATTQSDFLDHISEKILFREAYKVYLRMRFS
jgi:hypothetical protein